MVREAQEAFEALQAQGLAPDQISLNVLVSALLSNWVDAGRPSTSPLLSNADEIFQRGWSIGITRPPLEASDKGRLLRVDLHCQGTWSAQLAVLGVLAEAAAGSSSGIAPPALMLITGQGLKKGFAPLRETVLLFLKKMGLNVRIALANEGTIIVPFGSMTGVVRKSVRLGKPFDVFHWTEALVDPRTVVDGRSVI